MTDHTTLTPEAWARALRIEAEAPFTPQIGTLVQMMAYSRLTTIQAAAGLNSTDLNRTFPDFPHSVAMLLAYLAASERAYGHISFAGVDPFAGNVPDFGKHLGALTYGEHGPAVRGARLNELLDDLAAVRADTLAQLAERDDAWLAARLTLPGFTDMNHHWIWFHVMEEELGQRGQVRLLHRAVLRERAASEE